MSKRWMNMQLDKLVNFHKVMGDPTRVRILTLLANGPLHGQAIAGKLGLKPPTITHHMAKLKDINVIKQRREKNTIYFYLDEKVLKEKSEATLKVILREEKTMDEQSSQLQHEVNQILQNFLTSDGKLKSIPAQRKKKIIVLAHLAKGLIKGKKYTEKEINEYILKFHEDYATIRREFIMNHFMYRENGVYELNPEEMWAKTTLM